MGTDEPIDSSTTVTPDELDRYLMDGASWLEYVCRDQYLGGWVIA